MSILLYNFIKFIMLLYVFLVISFARYREYIICLISLSKFSDVLPVFTFSRAIGNLWNICLVLNILRSFPCFASHSKREYSLKKSMIFQHFKNCFKNLSNIFNILYYNLMFWFDFGFPFFIYPRPDLKLIWYFNPSFGLILPSLRALNNFTGFW